MGCWQIRDGSVKGKEGKKGDSIGRESLRIEHQGGENKERLWILRSFTVSSGRKGSKKKNSENDGNS